MWGEFIECYCCSHFLVPNLHLMLTKWTAVIMQMEALGSVELPMTVTMMTMITRTWMLVSKHVIVLLYYYQATSQKVISPIVIDVIISWSVCLCYVCALCSIGRRYWHNFFLTTAPCLSQIALEFILYLSTHCSQILP